VRIGPTAILEVPCGHSPPFDRDDCCCRIHMRSRSKRRFDRFCPGPEGICWQPRQPIRHDVTATGHPGKTACLFGKGTGQGPSFRPRRHGNRGDLWSARRSGNPFGHFPPSPGPVSAGHRSVQEVPDQRHAIVGSLCPDSGQGMPSMACEGRSARRRGLRCWIENADGRDVPPEGTRNRPVPFRPCGTLD
jgi:hypothetical protein